MNCKVLVEVKRLAREQHTPHAQQIGVWQASNKPAAAATPKAAPKAKAKAVPAKAVSVAAPKAVPAKAKAAAKAVVPAAKAGKAAAKARSELMVVGFNVQSMFGTSSLIGNDASNDQIISGCFM